MQRVEDGENRPNQSRRIESREFGERSMQAGIENADPEMFFRHLGAAQLSAKGVRDALALFTDSMARRFRSDGDSSGAEKSRDLKTVARLIRSLRP